MKFYVKYGCTCETVIEVIKCKNKKEAEEYAYTCAQESYESYAGLHGIQDLNDVAQEYFDKDLDNLTEKELVEVDELYSEVIENDIFYYVEIYNEANDTHLEAMEEGGLIEI